MTIDRKTLVTNITAGVGIAVLTAIGTWTVTRIDQGGDAIDKAERAEELKAAIQEAMIIDTPNGKESVATVILRIDQKVAVIDNTVAILLGEEPEEPTP